MAVNWRALWVPKIREWRDGHEKRQQLQISRKALQAELRSMNATVGTGSQFDANPAGAANSNDEYHILGHAKVPEGVLTSARAGPVRHPLKLMIQDMTTNLNSFPTKVEWGDGVGVGEGYSDDEHSIEHAWKQLRELDLEESETSTFDAEKDWRVPADGTLFPKRTSWGAGF